MSSSSSSLPASPAASGVLPAARESAGPYRVCVVCLGNICRSPIGEVVLADRIRQAGLASEIVVDSAGTGGWHVGEDMDPRSRRVLVAAGYEPAVHRARRFDPAWFERLDLVLAMDRRNLSDLRSLAARSGAAGTEERIRLFGSFAGVGEVPDPYSGGPEGFEHVLGLVERVADTLVGEHLPVATRRTG